jgi:hypothetical protein
MHLPNTRPLLAAVAAGAALVLLSACSGGGGTPAAGSAGNTPTSSAAAGASGSPGAGGASQASGPGGGSGSSGGKSGSGQPAGGSGGTDSGGAGSIPKPCTLLSAGEAGSAMHATGALTTKINSADECEYDAAGGAFVDVAVQAVPFTPDLPNAIAQIAPAGQVKRINGLGDAAVLFTPASDQAQFYLWKHGLAITIDLEGVAQAGTPATSVATTIAGRI